ncbi:MAG: DUF433 domain-containing protein [Deltaproteobacteria bacterium]|nr:DUF433 domain-containing protein [Deltaproteobacteria bacterium]
MDWRQHIAVAPEVLAGKPILQGTRLAVDFILGLLAEGWTVEEILENYPAVSPEALQAVFAFAAETLADETTYPYGRKAG